MPTIAALLLALLTLCRAAFDPWDYNGLHGITPQGCFTRNPTLVTEHTGGFRFQVSFLFEPLEQIKDVVLTFMSSYK